MSYTICIFNGNNGTETTYDTYEEARKDADDAWYHLTPNERRATTDEEKGAFFYISENDENDIEIRVAYDYADDLGPLVVKWTAVDGRRGSERFSDYCEAKEFYSKLCLNENIVHANLNEATSGWILDTYFKRGE